MPGQARYDNAIIACLYCSRAIAGKIEGERVQKSYLASGILAKKKAF